MKRIIYISIFFVFISGRLFQYKAKNKGFLKYAKKMRGFIVTAYTPFACCNGRWAGNTAVNKPMKFFSRRGIRIVAVDPRVIPLWSVVFWRKKLYLAVDTGGSIKGRRIDIHVPIYHCKRLARKKAYKIGVRRRQTIYVLKKYFSERRFK